MTTATAMMLAASQVACMVLNTVIMKRDPTQPEKMGGSWSAWPD